LADAGQAQHRVGDSAARVDQLFESRDDPIGCECDGADLDDAISGRVETRGLEIKGSVFRHRLRDSTDEAA
jgi:hypothetical protein